MADLKLGIPPRDASLLAMVGQIPEMDRRRQLDNREFYDRFESETAREVAKALIRSSDREPLEGATREQDAEEDTQRAVAGLTRWAERETVM